MTATDDRPSIALLLDPRFPGGTSSAVAQEIRALHGRARLSVHALETRMFKGRPVHAGLQGALDAAGLELQRGRLVQAEVVVLHNPSCLKFDHACPVRINGDRLLLVTHENLLRPDGTEGFDVAHCLRLVDRAALARARRLAPVSGYNRARSDEWLARHRSTWQQTDFDWFNICDFEFQPPNPAPRDRRGRHSRPGLEKFPPPAAMRRHFPATAEANRILGGDALLLDEVPAHWDVLPFGAIPVAEFLESIDFFVYFTHPLLRESFGRVIAEAVAGGKLVITDPGTGATFGDAVHVSDGTDVDAIIAGYLADPDSYVRKVLRAQEVIRGLSADRFAATVLSGLSDLKVSDDALL